jgi:hypothetical protein
VSNLLVIALMAVGAADEGVVAHATLDPPIMPYHKQSVFSVIVEAPPDVEVRIESMVDRFGGLGVYGEPEYERELLKGGVARTTERYVLDPILVGDYFIEPVVVTWGEEGRVEIPSPSLRVRDLTEAEEAEAMAFLSELADPVLSPPPLYARWYFWALFIAAVAAVVFALWWRRRPEQAHIAPSKRPWELAFERLEILDKRQYPKQGKIGQYYVDLSGIVRYYIEDRFHVHAPEQTTPEFLAEISSVGLLDDSHERLVAEILRHSDQVKFARYLPTLHEMEKSFAQVLQFVDETVPKVEEKAGEEAA